MVRPGWAAWNGTTCRRISPVPRNTSSGTWRSRKRLATSSVRSRCTVFSAARAGKRRSGTSRRPLCAIPGIGRCADRPIFCQRRPVAVLPATESSRSIRGHGETSAGVGRSRGTLLRRRRPVAGGAGGRPAASRSDAVERLRRPPCSRAQHSRLGGTRRRVTPTANALGPPRPSLCSRRATLSRRDD